MTAVSLSPGKDAILCSVNMPDERSPPEVYVKKTDTGSEVLHKVFDTVEIVERDYFGLTFKDHSGCRRWVEAAKTAAHQFKKLRAPIVLNLQVKYYPNDVLHLKNEFSRYLLYRQVRLDIQENRLFVPDQAIPRLLGYILQAEFSDWKPELPKSYPDDIKFKSEPLAAPVKEQAVENHKTLTGLSAKEMEIQFVQEVSNYNSYGLDMYSCKDQEDQQLLVGVGCNGISTFAFGKATHSFKWREILKMYFEGKQFFLTVRLRENERDGCLKPLSSSSSCSSTHCSAFDQNLPSSPAPLEQSAAEASSPPPKHKHLCAFRCQTTTQAKIMWKSAMDRKTFFTAASSGENNRTDKRSALSLVIRRSTTFNFAGRVQREVIKDDLERDPSFVRYTWASNTMPRNTKYNTPVQLSSQMPMLTPSPSPSARQNTTAALGLSLSSGDSTLLEESTPGASSSQQQQQQQQTNNPDLYNTPPASPELTLVVEQQQRLQTPGAVSGGPLGALTEEPEDATANTSAISLHSDFDGTENNNNNADGGDFVTIVGETYEVNNNHKNIDDEDDDDDESDNNANGAIPQLLQQRTYSVREEEFVIKQDPSSTTSTGNAVCYHRLDIEASSKSTRTTTSVPNGGSSSNSSLSNSNKNNKIKHADADNRHSAGLSGVLLRFVLGVMALFVLLVAIFEVESTKLNSVAPFIVNLRHSYYEPAKLAIVPRLQKLFHRGGGGN